MVEAVTRVEFPEWREEVVEAVRSLSDPAYQQRIWIDHDYPDPNFFDALEECIHTLFDDADVLPEPSHRLGALLRDDAEVVALRTLGAALEAMVDDLGDAPAEQYLADPRWPQVVRVAAHAHDVLTAPDRNT
jgi:hypothetical protein